ncbi:putative nrps-t1pks biosynthetic cluster [Metarhizium rileyi]|uniref:Putative nrps-t1pks biosynthetic cluster n=1 Tax=Metarhizium rileyi (strain RCEF 4871) TaxID=1649241 RepID=A0A5C6G6J8_METRR|nr:putative nrps-t1pks biosynthetic cluster [Metarhizium rileyi]
MTTVVEPIAIIGTGCRFPGQCDNPSKLWDLLRKPRDLLKEIPENRFSTDAFYHPKNYHHGTSNVRHSYILEEDLKNFDAQFFGINSVEAQSVDPQQRLLLETVYESLESAGLSVKELQGSDTAVYVGVMSADFTDMIGRDTEMFPTYFATGTARSILSNRLSYFFDWHGASMTIDTACSSSLIAMHQAVQTLRGGESSVAVVAGSNLILGPEQYIAESKLQMLSPTGRSRMWDSDADGYARGEGVAAIVLKTLSRAIADGDHIECVVRETGLNQDGRTPGITMPSAAAQEALIRATYARAGLDLGKRADRPQFFEAHGTGTPAGDPVEAEAISKAFFGPQTHFEPCGPDDTLFAGSIKTVIGHTEGTAGLAAVIKSSLALQAGVIPPNLLLNKVNPQIEPFYGNVQIVSAAQKWPNISKGSVRRVSVNSFGFGGANCHAILESFDPEMSEEQSMEYSTPCFAPFLFSAASESTLTETLERYQEYLKPGNAGATVRLSDLSWTLSNRRSTLPWRAVVTASSDVEDLRRKLKKGTEFTNESSNSLSAKSRGLKPRILAIFTGQGAQWPRMGAELVEKSPAASRILARLDKSLQSLDRRDRPTWSLREQLTAGADSAVGTASVSQPICTAVQILLVDMLRAAGIEFSAVIGHSSGEICAAYASGYLSSEDAIRVAYYRGLHMKSVTQEGAMLAVGTSYEDAKELCELPAFEGRVCVAASNSPVSVTLSGDAEAIDEIKLILDEEKKFTRYLKVDRAYHSHHMKACSRPYVSSLQRCAVQQLSPAEPGKCRWVSSVFTCDVTDIVSTESLKGKYWAQNLTNPVMFAEALQVLLGGGQDGDIYDLAIEIGPHPALRGPVSQTVQECLGGESIPYTSMLSRGEDGVESFSKGLGYIWRMLGEEALDLAAYSRFMNGEQREIELPRPVPMKGLPTYPWDHKRTFWHESRLSRAFRTAKDQPHELLGRQILDGSPDQRRWRNVLKRSEIDWLDGHQVQRQAVFPCAGYVSACVEASMKLRSDAYVRSIELQNFIVGQAVVFNDNDLGVETLIVLDSIKESEEQGLQVYSAKFSFYSSSNSEVLEMTRHANCDVRITYGNRVADLLPPRPEEDEEYAMSEIESDRFYNVLEQLGFGYSGPFRALTKLKRKLGKATGYIQTATGDDAFRKALVIHPATLDAGIQSIMLACCYPGDSMMRSIYLPTGIKRLIIDPEHCRAFAGEATEVLFDSTASIGDSRSLSGDMSIYSPEGPVHKAIQLEGLQTQPLFHPTESNDLNIFTELVWGVDQPDRQDILDKIDVRELDAELLFSLERVAYFYLRSLDEKIPRSERTNLEWHYTRLFAYVDHVLSRVDSSTNRYAKKEWQLDTHEVILEILERYPDNIDLRLMRAVGENMPAVVRGETTMLEHMLQDNKLNDFYVVAHGMPRYTSYLAAFTSQISHRYPHMHVLEIGAGTGGATKSFLGALGDKFSTYTFTDISSGFFEKARDVFSLHSAKMSFKVLDIEKDIEAQGFAEGSYDVIIASLVLHATRDLAQTLRNVRRLLKPGGYLLLLEITENDQMRFGLLFGGLQGWWLGYDDGRALSPCVGLEEWSTLLKQTGFSGIDTAMPHEENVPVPLSVIVSQAMDDRVQLLKQPLQQQDTTWPGVSQLTIIGGTELATDIGRILDSSCASIKLIGSLDALAPGDLPVGGTVLCLTDIEEPVFKSMNPDKLRGFQEVFKQSTNVLWVTQGVRSGDPFSKMVVGFGRTIVLEMLHLRLQFLDLDTSAPPDATLIAESLLRFQMAASWESEGESVKLTHSVEPELYLDKSGRFYIPRFKLSKSRNNRYNSGRRNITKGIDIQKQIVELVSPTTQDTSWHLLEGREAPESKGLVEIDVVYSVSRAVEVDRGSFLFPVLGVRRDTAEAVLALSPKQASRIRVPQAFTLPAPKTADHLQLFYMELVSRTAVKDASAGTLVIVLQPSVGFSRALERIATDKGAKVLYLAAEPGLGWDFIHAKATKGEIESWVASNIGADPPSDILLLDMGLDNALSARLLECLPAEITKVRNGTLLTSASPRIASGVLERDIRPILVDVKYSLLPAQQATRNDQGPPELELVSLNDFSTGNHVVSRPYVVCWPQKSSIVSVQVQPIHTMVTFRNDKTYWLVGLTGGLGLSLCEWMANQGARHIVISSRNPKVDGRWLKKMERVGIKVEVIANNVCDRESVQSVYNRICRTMPPIAGVAQGAMVLHDTVFSDLDMERIKKVMQPKVEGSTYLESIFHDINLDFFVFFSSMACVTGNPGQSAYAAANMFMSGLAAQRRRRGLNASVVNIGAIFGNGYVTRELNLAQQEFLRKVGNLWLSEQDFRQIFAEAVFASQPEHGGSLELCTGLAMIDNGDEFKKNITWFYNPMFQHCIKDIQDGESVGDGRKGQRIPVKTQLQQAVNAAEVHEIIHDAFAAKLRLSLQIEEGRPIVDLTADTLGIDSLFGVDIRSWFIKELQVEIPVLKILGGATVGEILDTAQELLSKELTPCLDPNDKSEVTKQKSKDTCSATDGTAENPRTETLTVNQDSSSRKADTTKAQVVKLPSVLRNSSPKVMTPSDDSDSQSMSSEIGARVSFASPDMTYIAKSTPSSVSWSEIDTIGGRSRGSVWSVDTGESEVAVSKKTRIGFSQSRIWFLEMYLQDPASALNITLMIDLDGPLDVFRFERAVKLVGQRHEALRTRFVTSDTSSETFQEVLLNQTLALEKQDIASDVEAEQAYQKLQQYRYKLAEGENMRILLLSKSSKSFRLIIGYHHINMDGISLEVVLRELQLAYNSKRLPSASSILQYPAFAEQQYREFEMGKWKEEIAFWKNEFGGRVPSILPLLPLAKTRTRTPLTAYSTQTAEFRLDREAVTRLQSACEGSNATLLQFHLAVFYTLLFRLVDVEDICIGISSANRQDAAMMQSVGMYLNLLPLVLRSQPNETFAKTLKLIRSKTMAAFAHSRVPFDVIVSELGVPRATTHSPLFQVLVNYRPGVSERKDFCGCRSEAVSFEQGQAPYDLSLDIIENPGEECRIIMAGQSALFGPQDMLKLQDMYKNLLVAFSCNPALRLAAPSLYDSDRVKDSLKLGQGPLHEYQWPETTVHRIDMMVERYGSKSAVVDGYGHSLTYSGLARRAEALAGSMQGIRSGCRVGVYLDAGADWICSLLAILRKDAVYVPLDAASGFERLLAIVQDSKPDLLLVDNSTNTDARRHFVPLLAEDQLLNVDHVSTTATDTVIRNAAKRDSVAALMYTSGSTGVPKGILMKHVSFRNNIEIMAEKLGYREGQDVTLQQSSFNFDMSLCQIFLALSTGATLHVVPRHLRADPVAISSLIASRHITSTTSTPSELISWIRYGNIDELRSSAWRTVQSGGEPVRDSLRAAFRELNKPQLRLVDCYGPTEITFCSHSREVDYQVGDTSSDQGLDVLPNYSAYIVDARMRPVPGGVPGEILIGGAGVVAGYLHAEMNTRGFAHDSFASPEFRRQGWTQLHRTGDFGRIESANGRLLLEGRIADDTQVKLRGLRIDLREIESAIIHAAKGSIVDCAVCIRQSGTTMDEYLVAFATAASDTSTEHLDSILHQLPLPQYMQPAALVRLETMPTNASGKIDRSALKSIPLPQTSQKKAPEHQGSGIDILSGTESRLKQLWEGVLPAEITTQHQISATSDFFHVGGSSMMLISLRAGIQDAFKVVVSLFQLFDASTLGSMAVLVDDLSSTGSHENVQEQSGVIDLNWDSETAISDSLLNVQVNKRFFTNPEVVVLTGSTGFLGQAILTRLLDDGIVHKIHCLAVRHDSPLFNSPKVVVHRGDLALPGFGLEEEVLSAIFSETHAIIHNGADVSFVKSYHSLKPANVEATKELVRLSLPHQTSFHYISTAAVANLTGEDSWEQRSVSGFTPPAGTDGYIATKWVSERYLEKVNDQCELPIWIHRPSSITGPGAPATDLMGNLVQYSRKIAAIPDTSSWRGSLDFISVDRAAMQIVDEVYEDYSWPGNVKYLYESGEEVVPLSNMKGFMERENGSVFKALSMKEWVKRAEEEGLNPLLGEYLNRAAASPLTFPRLVRHDSFF